MKVCVASNDTASTSSFCSISIGEQKQAIMYLIIVMETATFLKTLGDVI